MIDVDSVAESSLFEVWEKDQSAGDCSVDGTERNKGSRTRRGREIMM